jgi:hypothetical protein
MTIGGHIETFAGLPVVRFAPQKVDDAAAEKVAWRLSADEYDASEEDFAALFHQFLDAVGADRVTALVVGDWGDSHERSAPVALLAGAADRLTNLRALFVGEMTSEECEISWIQQTDVTPLLTAYPRLEVLRVRGAGGLELSPVRHGALRELAFESGGLPATVVRAVGGSDLPALQTLELWLGVTDYGGDVDIDDLAGILSGARLPALRTLRLRDAELADQVAAAVAAAPVVARLTELDLSMGILSDAGAEALLTGQPLTHLRRLDLSHHYVSDELAERLRAELSGVEVDLSDPQDEDDGERYVAVAE